MVYLDSAATTPVDKRVIQEMLPYFENQFGNPGSLYSLGRKSKKAIDKARWQVARLIFARQEQIVFTSGGSEANAMALHGMKKYLNDMGRKHIIVSAAEHDSVLKAAQALIKEGFYVDIVPICGDGSVSVAAIEGKIRLDTGLISVMYINNETGTENPVDEIGAMCLKRGILFHTDCVQAASCMAIDVDKIGCDFLSLSSHKIYGPKGVGALFIKDTSKMSPIIYGGAHQEFGLRAGTENVAGIVGFGKACEILFTQLNEDIINASTHKQQFYRILVETLQNRFGISNRVHVNGQPIVRPGKTLNIRVDGVDSQTLLLMLDEDGVYVSAGSACRSHESEPSHVLMAMGLTEEEARSSIRISFSRLNSNQEITEAAEIFAKCIYMLRNPGVCT